MIESFSSGIEDKILEKISIARSHITIMSAWFTNEKIINALISRKRRIPNLDIEILVTNDHINHKYFLKHSAAMSSAGIKTTLYRKSQLMHNKIILIDNSTYITGSYNLSANANNNIENIIILESEKFCKYYKRIFLFLTNPNYIDNNIALLYKYPDFCRELLSTYYPFTKTDLKKYHNKILLGDCFSHDVGDYNKISYTPGLIFNKSISLVEFNDTNFLEEDFYQCEYTLPVSRQLIMDVMESESHNLILSSFREHKDLWHLIGDSLDQATTDIEELFKRKIENCFPSEEMEQKIIDKIDIIKENDLWKVQFQPFLTKAMVQNLLKQLPIIEKSTLLSKNILRKTPVPPIPEL